MRQRLHVDTLRRFWAEAAATLTTRDELLHALLFKLPKMVAMNPTDAVEFAKRARYLWDTQFRATVTAALAASTSSSSASAAAPSGNDEVLPTLYDFALAELIEAFPPLRAARDESDTRPLMGGEQFVAHARALQAQTMTPTRTPAPDGPTPGDPVSSSSSSASSSSSSSSSSTPGSASKPKKADSTASSSNAATAALPVTYTVAVPADDPPPPNKLSVGGCLVQ